MHDYAIYNFDYKIHVASFPKNYFVDYCIDFCDISQFCDL